MLVIKFLSLILALLIPYSNLNAFQLIGGRPPSGAATCETQCDPTDTETSNIWYDVAKVSNETWWSTQFQAGSTDGEICEVCVLLRSATGNDPGYDITAVYIYSNNATPDPDEPNTSIGTYDTGDTELANITTNGEEYCLTGSSNATISDGTLYHVVINFGGTEVTDHVEYSGDASCATENQNKGGDGSTWNNVNTVVCGYIVLKKE